MEASKYWHSDHYIAQKFDSKKDFDLSGIDSLKRFETYHTAVMHESITRINWIFDRKPEIKFFKIKKRVLHWIEKITGWRVGEHKNYKVI